MDVGGERREMGCGRWEVRSEKWEVGYWRWETGGGKLDVRSGKWKMRNMNEWYEEKKFEKGNIKFVQVSFGSMKD